MKTKNIYQKNNRENRQEVVNVQRMTSLEIAEVAGKQHCDVMRAIRNMEPAWANVCGRKFALTSRTVTQPNGGMRQEPCYSLTKTECLYIATKFNDEARARLVLRWQELEPAWTKVNGSNFALVEYRDRKGELRPCYSLTKTECLYIATKFNDEARARLVLRWQELETAECERQAALSQAAPLIDLSGSRGSQASIVVIMSADGTAVNGPF